MTKTPLFKRLSAITNVLLKKHEIEDAHRRHMTKGQRAMAVAKIYPDPKRGVHSELNKSTGGLGFDKAYLSHARTVLKHAPGLVGSVLKESTALDAAYKAASLLKINASRWKGA